MRHTAVNTVLPKNCITANSKQVMLAIYVMLCLMPRLLASRVRQLALKITIHKMFSVSMYLFTICKMRWKMEQPCRLFTKLAKSSWRRMLITMNYLQKLMNCWKAKKTRNYACEKNCSAQKHDCTI